MRDLPLTPALPLSLTMSNEGIDRLLADITRPTPRLARSPGDRDHTFDLNATGDLIHGDLTQATRDHRSIHAGVALNAQSPSASTTTTPGPACIVVVPETGPISLTRRSNPGLRRYCTMKFDDPAFV